MHLYKFIDRYNNVIYVGKTSNLKNRLTKQHFTKNGHLPMECYHHVSHVEIATVNNDNEASMYELYYIQKYKPYYNDKSTGGGEISFQLPELDWTVYERPITNKKRYTRDELQSKLDNVHQIINTETRYMQNLIRDKDNAPWLEKLTSHELNEYLALIYSTERFIANIQRVADEHITNDNTGHNLANHEDILV